VEEVSIECSDKDDQEIPLTYHQAKNNKHEANYSMKLPEISRINMGGIYGGTHDSN
jgi:hypothetical protein